MWKNLTVKQVLEGLQLEGLLEMFEKEQVWICVCVCVGWLYTLLFLFSGYLFSFLSKRQV